MSKVSIHNSNYFTFFERRDHMAKKSSDVSVKTLEQVVKTQGDSIVTGYVRFNRVKKCNGYNESRKKANWRLSKIVGGRRLENGQFCSVISFRWIILLIIFLVFFIVFLLWRFNANAKVIDPQAETIVIPTESVVETHDEETVTLDTMDIPGFSDITLTEDNDSLLIYNPSKNKYNLKYLFMAGDVEIFSSEEIEPGDIEAVELRKTLAQGVYRITIYITGVSDNGIEMNSVCQEILITIK